MKSRWISPLIITGIFVGLTQTSLADTGAISTVDLKGIAQDLKLDDLSLKAVQVADQVSQTASPEARESHQVQLVQSEVGTIQLTVNGPKDFMSSGARLPLLFIAGGISDISNILATLSTKNLIVASYAYPVSQAQVDKNDSAVSKSIRLVPGQITLALEWISSRKYIDTSRMNAMGFDIGGLFLPVSLQLAALRNITVASIIFADSGASLNQLASVTKGYDSRPFLPGLKGPFLAIYGTTDTVVTTAESQAQYDLLANPKSIEWMPGGHLTNTQTEAIQIFAQKVLSFIGIN